MVLIHIISKTKHAFLTPTKYLPVKIPGTGSIRFRYVCVARKPGNKSNWTKITYLDITTSWCLAGSRVTQTADPKEAHFWACLLQPPKTDAAFLLALKIQPKAPGHHRHRLKMLTINTHNDTSEQLNQQSFIKPHWTSVIKLSSFF